MIFNGISQLSVTVSGVMWARAPALLPQRPESHGVHHQRGVHRYNYSDLPLWDMVFGTFQNPGVFEAEIGFYKGASTRIANMLLGRDVTEEKKVA